MQVPHSNVLTLVTLSHHPVASFFFFNDTATTEIYTLSLHDALPISKPEAYKTAVIGQDANVNQQPDDRRRRKLKTLDRKSTRLNSSHPSISYAVFCLKKKKST